MDIINWFRAKYRQFHAWQLNPFKYHKSESTTCCANCGEQFTGSFCPCCGQRASVGRMTLRSLISSMSMLWGIDTRSMPTTLWHLLWRPGYLIGDYLRGKRQSYFPPVKMLFLVVVITTLASYIFTSSDTSIFEYDPDDFSFMKQIGAWGQNNTATMFLLLSLFIIPPTWLLFREAPRYPHHTFVEGFFIQAFMATPGFFLNLMGVSENDIVSFLALILLFAYFIFTYKQLFGYSWWGTLWRTVFLASLTFLIPFILMGITAYILEVTSAEKGKFLVRLGQYVAIALALASVGYFIDHRRRAKPQAETSDASTTQPTDEK